MLSQPGLSSGAASLLRLYCYSSHTLLVHYSPLMLLCIYLIGGWVPAEVRVVGSPRAAVVCIWELPNDGTMLQIWVFCLLRVLPIVFNCRAISLARSEICMYF